MINEIEQGNFNDIYYYQPDKPKVDTSAIFNIKNEGSQLKVKTDRLNYLFSKLNKDDFDEYYNNFRAYLNFDFSPVDFGDSIHTFTDKEKNELEQKLICILLQFFTNNNFKRILIRRDDFIHPFQIKEMLWFINDIYGKDNPNNLKIGSHIFRIEYNDFAKIDEQNKKWEAMW